jgi:integrase
VALPAGSTKLATGIWRLPRQGGFVVRAAVGSLSTETRFDPDADLKALKRFRTEETVRLRNRAGQRPGRGTFAADADRYLALITHLASHSSQSAELHAWGARFGTRRRHQIAAADVRAAVTAWHAATVAPKTIANRLHTLRRLYRVLDGPDVRTPADGVRGPQIHQVPPVRIPDATIQAVALELSAREPRLLLGAKNRARFLVFATTGRRPSEIMRAQPEDVDLDHRVWRPRDGKGGWSPGLALNDDMMLAWRLFIAAEAWGAYRTGNLARLLRRCGWPAGVRVYNLRHTVGITLTELGVDLRDVAEHLGHKRLETTRKIYAPVQAGRQARVSALLEGRLCPDPCPETSEPERGDTQNRVKKR